MSMTTIIAQHSALLLSAVEERTPSTIADIRSAILFVLASWSGQSIAAFGKLTTRLAGSPRSVNLIVCDIDALPAAVRERLGELRGLGETFWIRDGQLVASLNDYMRVDWAELVDRNNDVFCRREV